MPFCYLHSRAPFDALLLVSIITFSFPAVAHHGVSSVGASGLQGPGAPVETATSTVLPSGTNLFYSKLDQVKYQRFTTSADGEADYNQYWSFGLGRGFTPWLSAYVFLPYNVKVDEAGGFDTRGFADVAFFAQAGFTYDDGFKLLPANESLDDLEDWHFTIFGGVSLPTGNANLRQQGTDNIYPGKSTGFGKPSFTLGLTATKLLSSRLTFHLENSYLYFQDYAYDDGNRTQFGAERRVNTALFYRTLTNADRKLRLDLGLEIQYLGLGRDRTNGTNDIATGGDILYAVPGARFYWDRTSIALGVKKPISSRLNEGEQQQGAEGKEDYRLILSASILF